MTRDECIAELKRNLDICIRESTQMADRGDRNCYQSMAKAYEGAIRLVSRIGD